MPRVLLTSFEPFDGSVNMGATAEEAAAQALNVGPLARAATGLDEAALEKIRRIVEVAYAPYQTPSGLLPLARLRKNVMYVVP